MSTINRILAATNFDAPSQHALDSALTMAERLGATITLLHVLDLPHYAYYADRLPADYAVNLELVALSILADLLGQVRERVPSANGLLCHGLPWSQIVEHAETMACDIVVLGSHARSGKGHGLLGSVGRDVSRRSKVPVLTVQNPQSAVRSLPLYS